MDKNISINIILDGEQHKLMTPINEYRSLMHLIIDKIYIEDFGECLGMGKCATCLVEITSYNGNKLTGFDRNEEETIRKTGVTGKSKRLSCQIGIDENLDGLELTICNN